MLTRQGLVKVKSVAIRRGVWYDALSKAERAIIDLTIKCVENVRSSVLARAITRILGKIPQTLQKCFVEKAHEAGSDLAKHLSMVAEKWGNKTAQKWKHDKKFIRFLGVTALNT